MPIDYSARMQRQRCKMCWHADGFDFTVPEWLWKAIVPPALQEHVVCLRCFDDLAAEKGIQYADHLDALYFAGDQAAFEFQKVRG